MSELWELLGKEMGPIYTFLGMTQPEINLRADTPIGHLSGF